MSDEVLSREPCPDCHSTDNLVRYTDGHAYCFSPGCGHREPPWDDTERAARGHGRQVKKFKGFLKPATPQAAFFKAELKRRKIAMATAQRFGYFPTKIKEEPAVVYPYYSQQGDLAHQKVRLPGKNFAVISSDTAPRLTACMLYGQQIWGDGNDKRVVVFTGEDDAHAAAEASKFRFPCVSVPTGDAGALEALKANYRWLTRFDEIILFFDNDSSGQEAAQECAKLFPVGKVKIAKVEGYKDASDLNMANRPGDITAAIFSAIAWRPKGIVSAGDCLSDFTDDDDLAAKTILLPWEGANAMARGLLRGHFTALVGGVSIGKTTVLSEIIDHALRTQPEDFRVGVMSFEASRKEVQEAILGARMSRRLALDPPPDEERDEQHKALFGTDRVFLFDPETAEWGFEAAMNYIRYMAKALGCGLVIVDPLTFLAAGLDSKINERRGLDKVAYEMARLPKELGIALLVAHHLSKTDGGGHEEGARASLNQIRGTNAIGAFASVVMAVERNLQDDNPEDRSTSKLRFLKNRPTGHTGVACGLRFDEFTGRLHEVPAEDLVGDSDDANF